MKFTKLIIGIFALFSSTIVLGKASSQEAAVSVVQDFVLTVVNNAQGINVKSNWNSLRKKIAAYLNDELAEKVMNSNSNGEFNQSLMRILMISASAQTMILVGKPVVIVSDDVPQEGKEKFKVKPYNSDKTETYEVTCEKKEVAGWFSTSTENVCHISDIEFYTGN